MTNNILMKKIFLLIIILLNAFCIEYFMINGIIENKTVDQMIDNFKSRGQLDHIDKTNRKEYYKIKKDPWMKAIPAFSNNGKSVGQPGDILVSRISPFDNVFGKLTGYFFGGHAATISHTGNSIYEIAGTVKEDYVKETFTNWSDSRDSFLGLRVNTSRENKIKFLDNIKNKFGEPYNYTFIFNTIKSHYCTDLLSKSYREVDKSLDLNDGFITSINDLILSKNTYIFYYQENVNRLTKIYYLE